MAHNYFERKRRILYCETKQQSKMNTSMLKRQLKDIQARAEFLLKGDPNQDELENFSHYSAEIKAYVQKTIADDDILKLTKEIPEIMEVENETRSYPILLLMLLGLATLGISVLYISYVTNMRQNRLILQNIQIARGKYASIDFMLKAKDLN